MDCVKPVNVQGIFFACGRCKACRINRTSMWALRLLHEAEYWEKKSFLTLTYDEENLPKNGSLVKEDLQKFWKRLRKNEKRKMKYYSCGEYGDKLGRPHYHAILFGFDKKESEIIEENWEHGFVYVGNVSKDSIKYVAAYVQKKWTGEKAREIYGDKEIPFQTASQGLGKRWALDNKDKVINDLYISRNGKKMPIPRYYKEKLGISGEDTIPIQEKMLQKEREWFEARNIGPYERYAHKVRLQAQKAEELEFWKQFEEDSGIF